MVLNIPEVNGVMRLVEMRGQTYISIMCWYAEDPTINLSPSNNAQKRTLRDLLGEMSRNQKFAQLLQYSPVIPIRTIVNSGNQRIDNQNPVNVNDPSPRLNMQYQIGNNSHAMVLVHLKPIVAPDEFRNCLIINENVGFSLARVEGLLQDAFNSSIHATTPCYTHLCWVIMKHPRPTSGDRDTKISAKDAVKMAMAKIVAKTGSETSAKVGAKVGAKAAAEGAAKKIPFVGAGIGLLLGAYRLYDADFLGALAEVASGVVSCVPGGTLASVGIDAALAARDISYAISD